MKKEIEIPTNCPSCSSKLIRVKTQLFCENPLCGATQIKKVLHYTKTMKIKGFGQKTIEKLEVDSISRLYTLDSDYMSKILGEKISATLLTEIEISKATSLDKFLAAFSIPLIGTTASKNLAKVVTNILDITLEKCTKAGLGTKATQSLLDWVSEDYPQYKSLPIEIISIEESTKATSLDIRVCMTGKLTDYSSRGLAAAFLEEQGITVVSGVSKALDYLINEDNKPSSKLSKANSYGIPIITIKTLIEEINNK